MIKKRSNCFETNSSSTHALIISTDKYNSIKEEDLLKLKDIDYTIRIFDGSPADKLEDNSEYNVEEGSIKGLKDKLRYIYTCMCQDGLYNNDLSIDYTSQGYIVYEKLLSILPNIKFEVPKEGYCYIFEDCEYIIDEMIETRFIDYIYKWLLEGEVIYCNRDYNYDLSESLRIRIKEDMYKYSIRISG